MESKFLDGLFSNSSDQMKLNYFQEKCIRNESGFQKIEFTYECFVLKLNEIKFVILTLFFLFLISLDIFANLIVILSIIIEKNKKRVDMCFMSNAIADLIMGLIVILLTFYHELSVLKIHLAAFPTSSLPYLCHYHTAYM